MIKFIENGNFTPVVRTTLCITGVYLILIGREFHLSIIVPQIGFFIKCAGLLSYRAALHNIRPFDNTFRKNLATYKDKKRYDEDIPVWMSFMSACVRLYCWPASYRLQAKMNAEKRRKQNTQALALYATAITNNGLCVIADIKQEDGCFFLGMSTRKKNMETEEIEKTQHHFASIKALSAFLESQTILRIGDFKSSRR